MPVQRAGDMGGAVSAAARLAQRGDIVLLAPAAASFDMYDDYAARGEAFRAAARAIASHPRIASRAREAGFGRVFEAGPGLDAVVACIQSMRP